MSAWIKASDRLPESETPVLVLLSGRYRIAELRWEHPTYEDSYKSFRYWDDPEDDGQIWEFLDITHWMALPDQPTD